MAARKITTRLEHEQHDCLLYSPGPDEGTWCGCLFLVSVDGREVAAVRAADALAAAKRLLEAP
jgi:hypothetical protein